LLKFLGEKKDYQERLTHRNKKSAEGRPRNTHPLKPGDSTNWGSTVVRWVTVSMCAEDSHYVRREDVSPMREKHTGLYQAALKKKGITEQSLKRKAPSRKKAKAVKGPHTKMWKAGKRCGKNKGCPKKAPKKSKTGIHLNLKKTTTVRKKELSREKVEWEKRRGKGTTPLGGSEKEITPARKQKKTQINGAIQTEKPWNSDRGLLE